MSSFHTLRFFKISNYVGRVKNIILKLLYAKFFKKRREVIRNPYAIEKLIRKVLKALNIEDIRNKFFKNNIFAYSKISERENLIEYIKNKCPVELEKYLKYAEEIIEGKFRIFERIVNFKEKINWHYSFFDNYNWDLVKAEKVNKHPKNKNIDIKYVWELNKHQFLPYLGFAYFYTGNKKYAIIFKNIINDWIQKNPPLYGVNWHSGLEISIRLISWIYALMFFNSSKEINNNAFFKKIFKSMFLHAYFLRYFYSKKSYNHTIGDIFGVYIFSRAFDKINIFKKWEKKFFKLFTSQIHRQTRPDGTHIEQSVNYHRFVLEFFALFLILNRKMNISKTSLLIEKMFDYLLMLMKPNGTFPLIGDSDDATVLLLNNYNNTQFNNLLNLGVILFKRGDLKYISKAISPISILLLGSKGYETFENTAIREPNKTMQYFQNAGYFVKKQNWSNEANYIFVDFGEFGPNYASHCHSDITNIIFCYKGKNILIDSGTYSYNKSWKERNLFRSSKSHNILTVNNKNQADIIDWFAWENKPKVKRSFKKINDKLEIICSHNSFKGFLVERKLIFNNIISNLFIEDKVIPLNHGKNKNFNISIYFHFDNKTTIRKKNSNIIIDDELGIEISSKNKFNITIEKFHYSPSYGVLEDSCMLNIQLKKEINNKDWIKIITNIYPFDHSIS
ncbi:MAG: alginate lyase family protein [Candidatus Hermodarchaeota archaeon]